MNWMDTGSELKLSDSIIPTDFQEILNKSEPLLND